MSTEAKGSTTQAGIKKYHGGRNRQDGIEHPKVLKGRTKAALKTGPHGRQVHADGTTNAEPNHPKGSKSTGYPSKDGGLNQ